MSLCNCLFHIWADLMPTFISGLWPTKKVLILFTYPSFFIVLFFQGLASGDRMNYYPFHFILNSLHKHFINFFFKKKWYLFFYLHHTYIFFWFCLFASCLCLIYSLCISWLFFSLRLLIFFFKSTYLSHVAIIPHWF